MKRIPTLIVIALIAFLIACQPEAPTETETTVPEAPAEPEEMPEAEELADEETPEEPGALDEIKELFLKKAALNYMVTYDMTTTVNGEQSSSIMTQYLDGADHMRFDVETQGIEARTYMEGNTFTSCTNMQGWNCFQMEHEPSAADKVQADMEENVENYDVKPLAPRTIAGKTTLCFAITVESGEVEYCFSKEGVPLYIKSSGEHDGVSFNNEMTATSYSTTVPSDAFNLPAEPSKFGETEGYEDLLAQYS